MASTKPKGSIDDVSTIVLARDIACHETAAGSTAFDLSADFMIAATENDLFALARQQLHAGATNSVSAAGYDDH